LSAAAASGEVEVVLDARADVGESPVWDAVSRTLAWVDIPGGVVHRFDPETGQDLSVAAGQPVGSVAPRAGGGLVLALRPVRLVREVELEQRRSRMNDGKCDSAGRFWAGTMAVDCAPGAGALYRLEQDGSAVKVLEHLTIPNGLDWSLDDRTMYFIDSGAGGVDAFAYDPGSGSIEHRRRLIDIPAEAGLPDGMTLDEQGFLWVALWGGSCVRRYAPDGILETSVDVPAARVTSCAFGGENLDELYITSARSGLSEAELWEQPHAGALFRTRPGVRGRPGNVFGRAETARVA